MTMRSRAQLHTPTGQAPTAERPQRQIVPGPSSAPHSPATGRTAARGPGSSAAPAHQFSQVPLYPLPAQIQARSLLSTPADPYEREAEQMAQLVTATANRPGPCACGGECPHCQSRTPPRRAAGPSQMSSALRGHSRQTQVPATVHTTLNGPGQPLDIATRGHFEAHLGHEFSAVRIHAGPAASRAAQALNAQAFTVGSRIVFGAGQFAPAQAAGRRLLAHELVHTVQQGAAPPLTPLQERPPLAERHAPAPIQRRTLGMAGACWFRNCGSQLENFFMIPEDGPPGFHPSGGDASFRVDDLDGLWFKFHRPKSEWFKIPDIGTGHVTCTDDPEAPEIGPAAVLPFATAGWSSDEIHTPNPY